jgi:hypothetical protein
VTIDGTFDDWTGIETSFDTVGDVDNGNIDIVEFAVTIDNIYLSFLVKAKEPLFSSQTDNRATSDGTTLRVLIDSDNDSDTGYQYPCIGVDHMVEVYGEGNGMVSTSLLYVFDNSKSKNDWNGFFSLTNLKANATANGLISTAMELQIPNFDLGIDAESGLKFTFAASDGYGNSDSTDISDLSRNIETQDECIETDRKKANGEYTGSQIVIDGNFNDWNQDAFLKSDNDDSFNANIDIIGYANLTEDSGDTFYYVNVEGAILGGANFIEKESRIKGKSPGYGIALEDNEIPKTYNVPVLNGQDQIFVFIDSDHDVSTGYMNNSIGADKLIEIRGHYGVITSSTISNYNPNPEIENDWNWIGETNTPAANDEDEIEILGVRGDYYLYVLSWDSDKDDIEPEIYNKIDLPDNETAKDGSRGVDDVDIPDWNSGDWKQAGADTNNADLDAADIFNTDSGSRFDNLMYHFDGEFWYFMLFLEGDPYEDNSGNDYYEITYAVLMEDSANNGDYDYVVATYRDTTNNDFEVRVWSWNGGLEAWQYIKKYNDCETSEFCRISKTDNQEHIAWAVEYSQTFSPGTDGLKAVIKDDDDIAFGASWSETRNPTLNADTGDYTAPASIPEFSTLLMPIASVILVVGYNNRLKRKYSNQQ